VNTNRSFGAVKKFGHWIFVDVSIKHREFGLKIWYGHDVHLHRKTSCGPVLVYIESNFESNTVFQCSLSSIHNHL
jgi:hypothetical protein